MPDEQKQVEADFLLILDGMIESTVEFIADDGLMTDERRIEDLAACIHVRDLFMSTFRVQED
jgi:hypothetical protein